MNWEDSSPNDLMGYVFIMVVFDDGYIPIIPPSAMIKPANAGIMIRKPRWDGCKIRKPAGMGAKSYKSWDVYHLLNYPIM